MKAKLFAAAAATLLCAFSHAGTVMWTGNAGDNLWGTAGNWSGNAVPTKNDDVSVGDNVTITANATTALPKTLTLGANTKLVANNNELQFWGECTISGGSVTGNLLAAQQGDSKLTISDCALINRSTGWTKGWYRSDDTAHVNFVLGSSGAASYTFRTSLIDNGSVYGTFVGISNPLIKFEGANIASETDFNETFMITEDAEAGTTTVSLMPLSGWVLSTPAVSGVTSSSATLSSTLRHLGEGSGTIVFAYADAPGNINLSNGEVLAGTLVEDATFTKTLTGLTDCTTYYFRFGVKVNGEIVGESAVGSFFASDYSAVFTGDIDNSWNKAGNWTCGRVPTTSDTILIPAGKSCERGDGLSFDNYDITIDGGSFTSRGEINPGPRKVLNGGTLSATTYVFGGADKAIVVSGSDIVSTRGNDFHFRGFYGDKPLFNFRSGPACTYTYNYDPDGDPPAFETEFNAVFKQGQIVVDGVRLTDADADRVAISTNTDAHTVTLTLKETSVAAAFDGASSAMVSGLAATLSVTVDVSGGKALYLLSGSAPDNLATETLVAAATQDGTTYSTTLAGAEETTVYWQFRLGASDDPDAVLDEAQPQCFFAVADGNVWYGSSSSSASVAANWSKGAVPTSSDAVYVVEAVKERDLDWDVAGATVASWTQIGSVVVSFQTASNSTLTVSGDVDLRGGTWTHQGSSATPDKAINVSVGGDMTVAAGVSVNAGAGGDGAETASRGYSRGNGPGYLREAGGSFAGEGGHIPLADFSSVKTYGSILDPFSHGSGGWGNGDQYAGGGIVKLVVAGTLTVNGTIRSRGFGYPLDGESSIGGAGSGGSVNITAGALAGSGSIDANGGNNGLYGPGSGGRVKVALTGAGEDFTGFSGTIEALGGSVQNNTQAATYDITPAAAGTVCLSTAADTAPTVRVRNVWRYGNAEAEWRVATAPDAVPSATHLPAQQDGDPPTALRNTRWELSGHGALRVTQDVRTYSLSLEDGDGSQCVYTGGHVLTVKELTVAGAAKRAGVYTAADLPGIVVGDGQIVVDVMPLVIVVK